MLHHPLSLPMSYFPTSPSYKSSHLPQPNSQPVRINLLLTSQIHALYIPLLSPLPPFSLPLKDSPATKQTSPANSLSSFSITSHSHRSNTLELAQTIYLMFLASHFTPPSHSCLDQSSSCFTPTPSTTAWRSSLAMFST